MHYACAYRDGLTLTHTCGTLRKEKKDDDSKFSAYKAPSSPAISAASFQCVFSTLQKRPEKTFLWYKMDKKENKIIIGHVLVEFSGCDAASCLLALYNFQCPHNHARLFATVAAKGTESIQDPADPLTAIANCPCIKQQQDNQRDDLASTFSVAAEHTNSALFLLTKGVAVKFNGRFDLIGFLVHAAARRQHGHKAKQLPAAAPPAVCLFSLLCSAFSFAQLSVCISSATPNSPADPQIPPPPFPFPSARTLPPARPSVCLLVRAAPNESTTKWNVAGAVTRGPTAAARADGDVRTGGTTTTLRSCGASRGRRRRGPRGGAGGATGVLPEVLPARRGYGTNQFGRREGTVQGRRHAAASKRKDAPELSCAERIQTGLVSTNRSSHSRALQSRAATTWKGRVAGVR